MMGIKNSTPKMWYLISTCRTSGSSPESQGKKRQMPPSNRQSGQGHA